MSKTKTAMKVGASIGAIGLAISAMTGAFGAWTDSQTFEQSVTAGVVDIASGAGTDLTTTFGPFAPSDTGFRLVTLTNTNANALALGNLTVGATVGSVTDPFAPTAGASDLSGAINVVVKRCTIAYTAGACAGGTETSQLTSRTVTSLSTPAAMTTATMAAGATHYYKIEYTVASDPAASVQGASAPVTWTFYADPRAAITTG